MKKQPVLSQSMITAQRVRILCGCDCCGRRLVNNDQEETFRIIYSDSEDRLGTPVCESCFVKATGDFHRYRA